MSQSSTTSATAAIQCRGLVKHYPDVRAVDGVELEITRGECFGLLGPNGAGKTTTIELLEGLKTPDAGTVELLGERWHHGNDQAIRERIGIHLQETELGERLTVEEILRLFRAMYARGRDLEHVLKLVELESKRAAQFMKLSGGQKQRLALGCALVGAPDLLFLDEPTTGLDPQARHSIWAVVQGFKREGGTVLLTTHYMEEAAVLCDRLAIMDHGKIIALGTPKELIAELHAEQIVELEPAAPLALESLQSLPGVSRAVQRGSRYALDVHTMGAALPAILEVVRSEGRGLKSLETHEPTLEDVFVHLTGRALRDD